MNIPKNEQETTINIFRDKKECYVWTSDSTIITRLDKLCEKSPENYKLHEVGKIEGEIVDKDYIITDKSLISFRSGKKSISEEEKKKMCENLRKAREKLNSND